MLATGPNSAKPPSEVYLSHAELFTFQRPSSPHANITSADIVPKTFAEIVSPPPDIILPSLSKAGTYQAVKINPELYRKCLSLCQHSLIARVVLNKGDTPWTLPKLKEKLTSSWGLRNWRLI